MGLRNSPNLPLIPASSHGKLGIRIASHNHRVPELSLPAGDQERSPRKRSLIIQEHPAPMKRFKVDEETYLVQIFF